MGHVPGLRVPNVYKVMADEAERALFIGREFRNTATRTLPASFTVRSILGKFVLVTYPATGERRTLHLTDLRHAYRAGYLIEEGV